LTVSAVGAVELDEPGLDALEGVEVRVLAATIFIDR